MSQFVMLVFMALFFMQAMSINLENLNNIKKISKFGDMDSILLTLAFDDLPGLRIQRMSAGDEEFGDPSNYPYLTVASPSCHDTSTTRAWYEEDSERKTRFAKQVLFQNFVSWFSYLLHCCPEFGIILWVEISSLTNYLQSWWVLPPISFLWLERIHHPPKSSYQVL